MHFDPQVSFILDIGGQDMKAIFVRQGNIQRIEVNEACSSGCGTFIETFARSLNRSVVEFAGEACEAQAPCDLGTRCTVFMNSRVKQALREGAMVEDISAGLAYSVIKNALHKVLKLTDTSVLGEHIVVQGGSFRNPAIQRSLEKILDMPVVCPDKAELMGAYGAALTARDAYVKDRQGAGLNVRLDQLATVTDYQRKTVHCQGCENRCEVTRLTFPNRNVFYTGNRCERFFNNRGKQVRKGANLYASKLKLLFDRPVAPQGEPKLTLGIPRALNFYENFPFWCTLFVEMWNKGPPVIRFEQRLVREGRRYGDVGEYLFSGQAAARSYLRFMRSRGGQDFLPDGVLRKERISRCDQYLQLPDRVGIPGRGQQRHRSSWQVRHPL